MVQLEWAAQRDAGLLKRLIAEHGSTHAEMLHRGGARLRRALVPAGPTQDGVPIRPQGTYLVTGGLGGLGGKIARHLASRYQARLVLTGRSALDASRQAQLEEIERLGGQAVHVVADSSDSLQLEAAIEQAHARFGHLHGVIHCAGLTRDSLLGDKPFESFAAVMRPKVHGSYALDEATRNEPLEFFVLFSSIASLTGNVGQADYAAANRFLDGFALARNARVEQGVGSGRTIAIGWPHWHEGGMRIADETQQWLRQVAGVESLGSEQGCRAFVDIVAGGAAYCAVLPGDAGKIACFVAGRPTASAAPEAARALVPGTAALELAVQEHLVCLLARELKIDRSRVGARTALEKYGLDSIGMMAITRDLESDLGDLPKTLFFEHRSIESLARHLVLEYGASIERRFRGDVPAADVTVPVHSAVQAPSPTAPQACQDIAIIGISGRYPDAADLEEFWQNLAQGRDSIIEVPPERWDWRETFSTDRHAPGKTYAKWGSFLDGHDCFDAAFFNVSAPEARQISPQERLFLQTAWATLEDAGYRPSQLTGPVGVFVGCMWGGYDLCGADAAQLHRPPPSAAYWSIANRVSYVLDVRGPSYTVDSACSSSLTALHLACESIRRGECASALAGGVNLSLHPSKYLQLGALGFASTDGRCRSFGEGGDGYVPGEGVGAVLLKSLADAVRDGDHVHAVIKSSAVNHGGRTNGYTVPDPVAQAAVVRDALQRAGIDAGRISYVEAHGTGTRLGDPIEIAGLTQAFGNTGAGASCAIASVKSNIGHLEAAAGIAALAKVVLQMRHRMLAPSLHADRLNPHIDFARSSFHVQRRLEEWPSRQGPRCAGISSFGAGGANAHVIVEEFEPSLPVVAPAGEGSQIFVLSARGVDRLQACAQRLRAWLATADTVLADVAYTLQTGREPMAHRLAVVAANRDELLAGLDAYLEGRTVHGLRTGRAGSTEDEAATPGDGVMRAWVAAGEFDAIAAAWASGQRIDWTAVHPNRRRRVPLPTYPFAAQRHWLAGTAAGAPSDRDELTSLLERLSKRQIGVDEALSRFRANEALPRPSRGNH